MQARLISSFLAALAGGALVFACGSPPPPPQDPSDGDLIPLKQDPNAKEAPSKPKEAAPAASSAAPAASSAAPEKKPRAGSGGPPLPVLASEKEVNGHVGLRGGIFQVAGGACEVVIPRESVTEAVVFFLALNTGKGAAKITPYKGQVGEVFRLHVRPETVALDQPGTAVASAGAPFQVKLAHPKGKTLNLAILVIEKGQSKYTVLAPKSTEEAGDGIVKAVFELPTYPPDAYIHLTSAGPT